LYRSSQQQKEKPAKATRTTSRRRCKQKHNILSMSPLFHEGIPACITPVLEENLISVRGYGLRTYESRQGRNAATVV
jgi:hypothetical protein